LLEKASHLQHVEKELKEIQVKATPQAVAAANALILKKIDSNLRRLQSPR
jgi:hypothetical protein